MHEKQQTSFPMSGPEDQRWNILVSAPSDNGEASRAAVPAFSGPWWTNQISLRFTPFTPADLRVKDTRIKAPQEPECTTALNKKKKKKKKRLEKDS